MTYGEYIDDMKSVQVHDQVALSGPLVLAEDEDLDHERALDEAFLAHCSEQNSMEQSAAAATRQAV